MSFIPISINNKLPFRIQKIKFTQIKTHWHDSLEILYVSEGYVSMLLEGKTFQLKSGDIQLINMMKIHEMWAKEECKVITVQIPYIFLKNEFAKYYSEIENMTFQLSPSDSGKKVYAEIEKLILKLEQCYYDMEREKLEMCSYMYKLLHILVTEFQGKKESLLGNSQSMSPEVETFAKLMRYIQVNYKKKINRDILGEIAGYSPLYISQLFRRNLDFTLIDYLNHLRLENAYKDLLYTDKSITYISEDNGFSSIKYFNKSFKDAYDMSPKEFRKMHKKTEELSNLNISETKKKYGYDIVKSADTNSELLEFLEVEEIMKQSRFSKVYLDVDFNKVKKRLTKVGKFLNIGRLENVLLWNVQNNIKIIQDTMVHEYALVILDITESKVSEEYYEAIHIILRNKLIPCIMFNFEIINESNIQNAIDFIKECKLKFGTKSTDNFFWGIKCNGKIALEEINYIFQVIESKQKGLHLGIQFEKEQIEIINKITFPLNCILYNIRNIKEIEELIQNKVSRKLDIISDCFGFEKINRECDSIEGSIRIIEMVIMLFGKVTSLSLGVASDSGIQVMPFSGQCGWLTKYGNKKSIFYVNLFLHNIMNSEVYVHSNYVIGKQGENYWILHLNKTKIEENETYIRYELNGIEKGNYISYVTSISNEYGNIVEHWEKINSPVYLDNQMETWLQNVSKPLYHMSAETMDDKGIVEYFLPSYGINLIKLIPKLR